MLWAGLAVLLLGPAGARASLIVSVQSVTAAPGSSANGLEVLLSNTGPSDITIAAFSFGVTTANPNISFTDANTSTVSAPYLFLGHSLFGPDLTGATSGQSLSTSDVFDNPLAGATLLSGTTAALGHILFDVSPGAGGGTFLVPLAAFPATSLADPAGSNINFQASFGQITITGAAATPEPSTLVMLLSASMFLSRAALRRRGRRSRSS